MTTIKIGSLWRERPGGRKYHIQYEGYVPGPIPLHAQLEDLQMLGFEILNPDPNGCYVRRNGGTCPRSNWERSAMGNSRDAAQTKGILAE